MNTDHTLPTVHDNGCFEIRLESIGGLGANVCGKLLGELGADKLGFNAASFSSYGSEKRGSPVKAFVRWAAPGREIRVSSPILHPHVLGLFHEAMAGKLPVTAGVTEKTRIVLNTAASPQDARDHLRLPAGILLCVDAQRIAMEQKTRVNMVMLGAVAKATGFVELEPVLSIVKETLGKKYPEQLERNLSGVRAGYEAAEETAFPLDGKYPLEDRMEEEARWGYENAPLGGVNPLIGSLVSNDVSASRQGYLPLFLPEKCIHCGQCDSTCPDMVFQFAPGEYRGKPAYVNTGLDYHHCKGCLRCVEICPTAALVRGLEAEHPHPVHFVRNLALLPREVQFDDVGANSWITSESYLDEKRMEGGLV